MTLKYRAWLLRVLAGKVAIQTVAECDRHAANVLAAELGIDPPWNAKPIERKAEPVRRVRKESPVIGHVLNLGGRTYDGGAAAGL